MKKQHQRKTDKWLFEFVLLGTVEERGSFLKAFICLLGCSGEREQGKSENKWTDSAPTKGVLSPDCPVGKSAFTFSGLAYCIGRQFLLSRIDHFPQRAPYFNLKNFSYHSICPAKEDSKINLSYATSKANDYILNSMTSYYNIQIHKPICVNNTSSKPLKHMCNYYKTLWSHSTWVKVGGQVRCQANENLTNLPPPYHYHNEKNGRLNHSTDKNHMEKLCHKGKSYQPLPRGQKEFNWS